MLPYVLNMWQAIEETLLHMSDASTIVKVAVCLETNSAFVRPFYCYKRQVDKKHFMLLAVSFSLLLCRAKR